MGHKDLKPVLSDKERFPLIDDFEFLNRLRQHEFAPKYNFKSGDRLDSVKLEKVRQYKERLKRGNRWFRDFDSVNNMHSLMKDHLEFCRAKVPFYKDFPSDFDDITTISREDLRKAPWNFVSDVADVDDLILYSTSGTTGPPIEILFDAVTQGCYLPKLEYVLSRFNIQIEGGKNRVSIALICHQEHALTYASLSSYLDNAGFIKVNLNESEWRSKDHNIKYLEELNPEILTGDPFSFSKLMELNPNISPKALVSSAIALLPGMKKRLEEFFNCPVIDIYSITECRMIAYNFNDSHRLIRPDLFVEIFDPKKDKVLPPGEFGEITITSGLNPFLNLIRYRTGDYGKLKWDGDEWGIGDFTGRNPVLFLNRKREVVNSIDIAMAFEGFEISGYTIHQNEDLSLKATIYSEKDFSEKVTFILEEIFGELEIKVIQKSIDEIPEGKLLPFTSGLKDF